MELKSSKLKKTFLSGLFLCLFCVSLNALEVPKLQGRINDYANIIDSNTKNDLVSYLSAFEEQTGMQIVVLTIPSLQGDDLSSFSINVAEKWGIGRKNKDDGVLLLVAYDERMIRIEVGYGLEADLTDSKSGLIIRNVIIPEFKMGDYSKGILKGVQNIGGIISGDTQIVSKQVLEGDTESGAEGIVSLIFTLIFFFIIVTSKGGILKWLFLSSLFGNSGKRSNFSSSSFGSGSSFSNLNSFSGGGGHFGGGGASGRW